MAALLAACGPGSEESSLRRVAFLPAENLSGDASLDWIASALPAIVAARLAGSGNVVPVVANSVHDAYQAGATRLVHGYFDRRGGRLHFDFSTEDSGTHKMIRTLAADGQPLEVAGQLVASLSPSAGPFSSANPDAVEAWGRREYERAVALDPDFGAAWLAWAQTQAAAGQTDAALETASHALDRSGLRSPIDQANLRVLAATLRGDPAARRDALAGLLRLLPNDSNLARTLAEEAMAARHFDESVRFYRQVIRLDPDNAEVQNLLGYALTFAGDLPAARQAFDAYAKFPGHEANALDSQGEALFLTGQFAAAETYFLQAHAKDPNLLQGSDLLKAAYAQWLAGDLAKADATFARYMDYRMQQNDSAVGWRQAVWLYATGRRQEAMTTLEALQGPTAQLAAQQLAVWRSPQPLPEDLNQLEQLYQRTPPSRDGLVRVFYARALLQAGKRDQARDLLKLYPLPESGDALHQSFMYPTFLDLKKQLQQSPAL